MSMRWALHVARAALVVLALCLTACASHVSSPGAFSFALIGDTQYDEREEALFDHMLDAINASDVKFVVHVGDFKAGSFAPCSDALFQKRLTEFNRSRHPFIYIPGDNEWVDCRRPTNGATDPLERLQRLRDIFYADRKSLGVRPIALLNQSDVFARDAVLSRYRENMLWTEGGIVFATVNVQGSNDNVGFDAASDREQVERTRANIAWLQFAAAEATKDERIALGIFLQANPGFESSPATVAKSAFRDFLIAFESTARALGKPILLMHGDNHEYRVDRPYRSPLDRRAIDNVTRVQSYGSPFVNWVRITVDPLNPANPFAIRSGGFAQPHASE